MGHVRCIGVVMVTTVCGYLAAIACIYTIVYVTCCIMGVWI